jgi:hypothetical protein
MANETIYPYGTNGQLPSSIGVINDLTTGGADKALSAEMGKELNIDVNGFDFVGTWHRGAWGDTTSLSIGDTYGPNAPLTDYSVNDYRYCEKFTVKAGEQYHIITKCNKYNRNIVITTIDGEVVYLGALDTNVANYTTSFEYDVIVYVNAHKNFTDKVVTFSVRGHEQRIATLEKATAAMFFPFSFVEGQRSAALPIISGKFPYPNGNTYFMELNSSGHGCTPWIPMPHGTYIVPNINVRVYQADHPFFQNDYAKLNDNIWSVNLANGGGLYVTHDYVMFAFVSSIPSGDFSVYCDKVTSTVAVRKHVAHVAHVANGDFVFYLPLRDKYYCFLLKHYSAVGNQLEHYGISDTYLCDSPNFVYPQTPMTRASEYECAIDIQGQGYLGGHMHGYERMVSEDTTIYINGQSKTLSDAFGEDVTWMFEMMQHSVLYKTDKATKVADIYKRWRVVDGKLHMYNRVVFAASYHINRGQFSMFGIYRHEGGNTSNPYLTCFASRNSDTRVYHTTDGWDTSSPTDGASIIAAPAKATLQEQWGESGYIVRQEVFENNQKENGGMFINTNGGGEYNKMYFEIGSNFDVADGDELFSHAVLSIE